MSAAADWQYQPPFSPPEHPNQRYYRVAPDMGRFTGSCINTTGERASSRARVELFRFVDHMYAELRVQMSAGRHLATLALDLGPAEVLILRNALNDALADLADLNARVAAATQENTACPRHPQPASAAAGASSTSGVAP